MARLLIAVLFLSLLAAGCSVPSSDERAVKEAVRKYNQLLAEGYARMEMEPLLEVAGKEEFSRVLHHMIALREAKLRLESHLTKLDFSSITMTDARTARVTTREVWDFTQVGVGSGATNLQARDVIHLLSYDLAKNGDKWLVKRVTPLDAAK